MDVIEELKFLGKFTQKKIRGRVGRGQVWGSGWWWGQGGCERRIEIFVKIQKKNFFFWGGGGGGGWVRVDVNAMLGVGDDVGYGGCEPRIKGIVQCTKRY